MRVGWVDKEDEYLYSSASNYKGLPAFIAVDWIGRCSCKLHLEWEIYIFFSVPFAIKIECVHGLPDK